MAKLDIKSLNYITTGKRQVSFNISYCYTDDGAIKDGVLKPDEMSVLNTRTFFGDIGEDDTMNQKYATNIESLYDIDNNVIIHNLYDMNMTKIQSTAEKYSDETQSYENQDIILPYVDTDVINICQFQNYAYGLTKRTTKSAISKYCTYKNLASKYDYSYSKMLCCDRIKTYLYPKPSDLLADCSTYTEVIQNVQPQLSNAMISAIFQPHIDLKNIEYNYMFEMPMDTIVNDYTKGYIQGDVFVGKNHLNALYDMDFDERQIPYQQLQYIEFTGSQYIDTSIIPVGHMVQIEYMVTQQNQYDYDVIGSQDGNTYYSWTHGKDNFMYGTSRQRIIVNDITPQYSAWYEIKMNLTSSKLVKINNLEVGSKTDIYSSSNLLIGKCTNQNTMFKGYVRRCKIYDNLTNSVVADIIPVKYISTGEVAMYNLTTNEFLHNKGTGSLKAGPIQPASKGPIVRNCRDYCNMNVCGDKLYVTYRDNLNYTTDDATVTYAYPTASDEISKIDVAQYDMELNVDEYSYQHVEVIHSLNRYDGSANAGHKTSLFSIILNDTGLNNSTIDENAKEKLRQMIKNSLRNILQPFTPANTQLFDIYFSGK